ncbi:MAG TPA: hypothetical protein VHZ73_03365 [Vicinamibacterales bacterium]|jgi:hypothetical protein|nr:hypothetical protein [Vicinamibacterales bacterium]
MTAFRRARAVVLTAAAAVLVLVSARHPIAAAESDLDAFMRQVMARRDDNWKKLQQYVLDEREQMDLRGPGHVPLWGEIREYAWYIRDGFFVRSPVRFNNVTISEPDRRKYEADYLRREQERDRRAERGASRGANQPEPPPANATDIDSLIRQTRQPEFISSAYFLRFRFDEGRYALVGRERLDDRDVLRIEYYPATMFSGRTRGPRGDRDDDTAVLTLMDKASRVTLWVEQSSHQIVKFTFENVTPNFIPSNFLARLSSAQASMTMGQPFPDVWLPSRLEWTVGLTFAVGQADLHYTIDYRNYRQAEGHARIVPNDLP